MDFNAPLVALGGLSPRRFLDDYWQKKPLVMRGAVPHAESVITPGQLRTLAQRDDLVSRLILQDGGDYPWQLLDGPFSPRDLRSLRGKWALLVQEVDRVLPEARALLDPLAFMPRWRLDDVMVSLAPDGSGVGAHIDHYDVFLVQGAGQRRWRITSTPVEDDAVHDDLDVSVLQTFDWTEEYILNPGDVLYLPPRIAHEGVAIGECITISIGFRAPSATDLVGGWLEDRLLSIPTDRFYEDPDLRPTEHPGEISEDAIERARTLIRTLVDDADAFRAWFGQHVTEPRRLAPGPLDGMDFDADAFDDEDDDFEADALDLADAASGDGALSEAPALDDAAYEAFAQRLDDEIEAFYAEDEAGDYADGHPGADAVADLVRSGLGVRHAPGSRIAYVRHPNGEATIFANSEAYGLEADLAFAAPLLADRAVLGAHDLLPHLAAVDFPDLLAALLESDAFEWDTEE